MYTESLKIAKLGSEWLERLIEDDGRFIYGYDCKSLKRIKGYNILRHFGSLWAMLDVYRETKNPDILNAVQKSLDYMEKEYIQKSNLFESGACWVAVEDSYIKLGANGLGACAFFRFYSIINDYNDGHHLFNNIEYLNRGRSLIQYIANCINPTTSLFDFHKRNVYTGKDKKFYSSFYPGEALLALSKNLKFLINFTLMSATILQTIAAYYEYFGKVGFVRDHWMMQAIEEITKYADPTLIDNVLFPYASKIVETTLRDRPSKAAGPMACRSECLLSYIRFMDMAFPRWEQRDIYLNIVKRQLKFQAKSFIKRGLSKGAFTHSPIETEVRNDYCQHNISSFIGYYRLLNDIAK